MFQSFLNNLVDLSLEASPWLVLGLVVAGLLKVWMPTAVLRRWLGGTGLRPVVLAALLGTPLPLCSCSVIPAAVTLRRSGASKGATTSFLVATPENGADSIALTYALLGPFMTIVRPIAAILSAVVAGVLTMLVDDDPDDRREAEASASSCCDGGCGAGPAKEDQSQTSLRGKALSAVQYAGGDLLKDIVVWLAIGLVLAAVIQTFVPADTMSDWGSGLLAMLAMLLIGVPMYICATASTPVAAAMIAAGVSPGTALVFLLAGPATNLGTVGIVRSELGTRACAAYLVGVCGGAVLAGLAVDQIALWLNLSVAGQAAASQQLIPGWLELGSLALLLILSARIAWHRWQRAQQQS